MKYLFIGEDRSQKAIRMGVRLDDGRLAAKQLFDALDHCNIPRNNCKFINLFEPIEEQNIPVSNHDLHIVMSLTKGYTIVGMGNKVSTELNKRGFPHIKIVHPAARGKIRKKERYLQHVKENLLV